MNPKRFSLKPSSIKSRFTRGFLRALTRINRQPRPSASSSPREICQRYLRVKTAADASMASAVGSRRAWSRAVLHKIRHDGRRRRHGVLAVRRISSSLAMRKRSTCTEEEEVGICQENKLRKLVPGGEAMDMGGLLGETAHYIKCLTTQVKVMKRIADIYST